MARSRTLAMVSSSAKINSERVLIHEDLKAIFDDVEMAPEQSVAGSKTTDYLESAANADFLVVLLGQESRPAVRAEIQAAYTSGAYIAGFTLNYPPVIEPGEAWISTPEETFLREKERFVSPVKDIIELRNGVMKAVGRCLSESTRRLQFKTWDETYSVASEWLRVPTNVRRVALVQRTSSVFLGAQKSRQSEIEFCERLTAFLKLVHRNGGSPHPKFVHLFDTNLTIKELENFEDKYTLKPVSLAVDATNPVRTNRTGPHICGCDQLDAIGPLILVDDKIGYGMPVGPDVSFVVTAIDRQQADKIFEALWKADPIVSQKFMELYNGWMKND